jgi:general secretion pathway protein F
MAARQISEKETGDTLAALADALRSGVGLVGYLNDAAASRIIDRSVRSVLRDALRRGKSLTDAVAPWAGLSTAELTLLRAGERAGRLADALDSVARSIEERRKTRRRLAMGLAYPAFLIVMASVIMPLPKLVQGGVSSYLASAVWAPIGVAIAGVLLFVVVPRMRRGSSQPSLLLRLALATPLLGGGLRCSARATFAEVLAQTISAGVSMPFALSCALASAEDPRLQATEAAVLRRIEEGSTLTKALDQTGAFPHAFIDKLAHAEAVGTLDTTLAELADAERLRARRAIIASILVASAVVIGLVMVAIIWGIIDAYRSYFQSIDDILQLK